MKVLKHFSYLVLTILLIVSFMSIPEVNDNVEAKAKTLRDLKNELAASEAKLAANQREQALTKSEINNSKSTINSITQQKITIAGDIEQLEKDIKQLNEDIINLNQELKDVIRYYQMSNTGDSAAMEYVFNSSDFSDFIYRTAISEQLGEYNSEKIKEYNDKIAQNEKKKIELADKTKELNNKESELESYIDSQQGKLSKFTEGAVSLKEEVEAHRKLVNLYEKTYKCKLDQSLDDCIGNRLPPGTAFYRPVVSGRVSSNYSARCVLLKRGWDCSFHYGVDFAVPHRSNVYSTANGQVAAIFTRSTCGGNMVYINHIVNGKKYTSGYYHLATIKVKVGQAVTYNTVIGLSGGDPRYETWDRCSTGAHVHFTTSTGNWGTTYKSYSGFISKQVNPRSIVNIPVLGSSFTSRTRKY
jgi:murein DD-endopeptidase MepM/ murein hydrolase activator NlpD